MKLKSKAHKFGSNINTDYIIASKHRGKALNYSELSKHLMEDIKPGFINTINNGDFIVADENFGCGSSRGYAPKVILEAGIKAVIAKSFARIFFRNAINIGLLLIETETTGIEDGDELSLHLDLGYIYNITKDYKMEILPLPEMMQNILKKGGLVNYLKLKKNWL